MSEKRIPQIESITAINNSKRLASSVINSFPALACNYTPGITLVLTKLISLASDHGFRPAVSNKQHNNHIGRRPCRNAGHVSNSNNQWVRSYLSILSLLLLHLLLYLQLQSNSCLFVCFSQQSFIINNNADTSAIKIIATTMSFPSSTTTTGTPQQLQPEREPTMAMAIALY